MTADLNAAANQLTADIMAEVETSEWLRGKLAAAWDAGYGDDLTCNEPRENPYREGSSSHRPNNCCDFHRHIADGCCHCGDDR